MRAQHDRCSFGGGNRHHSYVPCAIAQGVGNITYHLSWEALVAIGIGNTESDAIRGVRDDREVSPIPSIWATVQSINTSGVCWRGILIWKDMIGGAINLEAGIFDAIGIASWHSSEVRVLLVKRVVGGIVKTTHNVALDAMSVIDEEIGDGGAVGHKVGADAYAGDLILAIGVCAAAIACD